MKSEYMKRKQQLKHRILRGMKRYHAALSANKKAENKGETPPFDADKLSEIKKAHMFYTAPDREILAELIEAKRVKMAASDAPKAKPKKVKLSKTELVMSLRAA